MGALGIIDWGIGGIGIYKLIKERLGDVSVIYFSDTGVTPYGKMTRGQLVARLNTVVEFLKSRSVTHLVIGCNAASTAIPYLNTNGIVIEGMIEGAVEMTSKLKPKRLGLIGGRRTVVSGVYRRAFTERGINIQQRIAQPLSGLIESGDVSSDRLRAECGRILAPLKNCSHLLLACTHYPAIAPVMRDFISDITELVDPAASLLAKIEKWKIPGGTTDYFLTSGDVRSMAIASRTAFGVNIDHVRSVKI